MEKFNPRRYLEMADIELEHDREGVHYRLADRVDIVALLAIERDVYNGDIPWTFSHFEHEIVKNDEAFFIVAEISGSVIGFIELESITMVKMHISLISQCLKPFKDNKLLQL